MTIPVDKIVQVTGPDVATDKVYWIKWYNFCQKSWGDWHKCSEYDYLAFGNHLAAQTKALPKGTDP